MKMWRVPVVISAFLLVAAVGFASGATYNGYPIAKLLVNGKLVASDVPAIVMDGHTLTPARAIAEGLGADVSWNQSTQTVEVWSHADARAQYCFSTDKNWYDGAQLTLDGWRQYIEFCGSAPGTKELQTPDARSQFCTTWAAALDRGTQFTLDGWKLYTGLCSKT